MPLCGVTLVVNLFLVLIKNIYHRLLSLGLSHEHTVLAMYGVSVVLSLTAIIMALVTTAQGMLIMVALILGLCIEVEKLGLLQGRKRKQVKHGKKVYQPYTK